MDEQKAMTEPSAHRRAPREVPRPVENAWGGRSRLVLVPLDGSAESKVALLAARLVAEVAEATIHIMHALDEALGERELAIRLGLERSERRGAVLHGVTERAEAAEVVVRYAETTRAMLIAISTRGRTAYQGLALRPVVQRIITRSTVPILLVRPELADRLAQARQIRRVLVPLDGAPSSAAAIGPALDLARRASASVDVLYVASFKQRPTEPGAMGLPRYQDQPHHEWATWAAEFLSRFGTALGACPCPPETHLYLRRGSPVEEILQFAAERESDIIVLAWHGNFDPEHAEVVREVIRSAPCPVLLLRAPTS